MDNCALSFKNTLTSSSHDNFGLDIFYSKTIFQKSYFYTITYIAYEHIHLAPGSYASVKYTQLLANFCLIV